MPFLVIPRSLLRGGFINTLRQRVSRLVCDTLSFSKKLAKGIHAKRDKLPSIAYSEELICAMSITLQSTDRHDGIVGQERCHFQGDS